MFLDGREAWLAPLPDPDEGDIDGFGDNVANSDLLVCVGGDGTVLHASEQPIWRRPCETATTK